MWHSPYSIMRNIIYILSIKILKKKLTDFLLLLLHAKMVKYTILNIALIFQYDCHFDMNLIKITRLFDKCVSKN